MVTRYHAAWVIPVAAPPIPDATVIVEGERIAWVGPRAHAPAGEADIELGDRILTPGIVNAHTHLDLTVMRGFLEDLPFAEWIGRLVRGKKAALSAQDLRDSALLGVAEGLAAGITTYGDTADSDGPFEAMLALGVRGIAYREALEPDPARSDEALALLEGKVRAMRARRAEHPQGARVRVGVSPHAPYTVSDPLFRAVAELAARESLPVAVHIAESDEEDAYVMRGEGPFADFLRARGIAVERRAPGPVALLKGLGLLRAGTLLIHCVRASDDDVRGIAQAGCGVAHCPASNAKLGHGTAPLLAFIAAGARVGLGSDSMASNNQMDLLGEARIAVLQQRARHHRADALSARAAFRLATLGGAEALRLDDEIGSLEIGKQADLVAFSLARPRGAAEDPVTALVFSPGAARADLVLVAGEARVRDGEVLGLDPAAAPRVAAATTRLSQWRSARTDR